MIQVNCLNLAVGSISFASNQKTHGKELFQQVHLRPLKTSLQDFQRSSPLMMSSLYE